MRNFVRSKALPFLVLLFTLLLAAAGANAQQKASKSSAGGGKPAAAAPAGGGAKAGGSAQAQAPATGSAGAAQDAGIAPPAGTAPASQQDLPVTVDQLKMLREDLRAGEQRLAPLIKAVDTSAADAWLAASPVENLTQRAAAQGLSDAERALWQSALQQEQAAAELVRGALSRAQLAIGGKERLDDALHQVDMMLASMTPGRGKQKADDQDATVSQLEQEIDSLNSRRAQIALELNQRRQTLAQLEDQVRGQAETLDQLRRDRGQQNGKAAQQPQDPALAEAQRAARDALDRRTEARLIVAQLDTQTMPARIERLRLEIREHEIEGRWLGTQIAEKQAELGLKSTEELTALGTSVQQWVDSLSPADRTRFAQAIKNINGQIDDIGRTQSRIRALQLEREEDQRTETDLTQTLADVNERLQVGGLNQTVGGLFLEEQRRLRTLADKRYLLREIDRETAQARLLNITLREQRRATRNPGVAKDDTSPEAEYARLESSVVREREHSQESLVDQLHQTETHLGAVVALVNQLEQILSETLLWWPSHSPVGLGWAVRFPAALMALLDPAAWHQIRAALIEVTLGSPWAMLGTLMVVGLLYRAGRGTGRHLRSLAEKTQHRFTDNIGLTFKAIGWSLLRVLPVPVLLMTTSLRLRQVPEIGPGVETLTTVMFNAAIWWMAGHLVAIFISRNGVGTVHFEWNAAMVQRLRRNLAWYLPTQFVLIIAHGIAFGHPSDLVFDVFGRAALVISGIVTGLLAWRLLAPSADLAPAISERKRRAVRFAAVIYAAALVVLALAGYLYTVSTLFQRTIDTAVVVVAVWFGYRLAARALILGEMRLRIRRMLEQRAKAAAAEGNAAAGEGAVDVPEPHLSLEDVNQQTRALVRVVAGGVMVLALFWVWADILPALAWLDGVTLWSRTIMVGGTETVSRVSLQSFLLAVFLMGLFGIAARNLPGLVEIVLTRTTNMDGASRYTAATLLRYVILVAAVISVFSLLGLRWSELQWMVAALTLGLGFGLQEVVANFVSGLIILFERPARVGDTITIGEYSGTVSRIRTRATTIIDWDNREVVVPNKMFITDRLINWTLSDTVTRAILTVGVSYSADVDLVIETLTDIAEAHPLVMKDPPPKVLFMKFGDSTLDFELRVYVNQLRERWQLMSDLHLAIVKAFRERGIEIAFPQVDLHVRDVPGAMPLPGTPAKTAAAASPAAPPAASAAPGATGVAGASAVSGASSVSAAPAASSMTVTRG